MNVLDFGSILAATVDVVVAVVVVIFVAVIAAVVLVVLADRRSGLVWRFSPEKEQESRGKGGKSGKNSRPGARTNLMRDIQKFVVAVLFAIVKIQFLCIRQARVVSPLPPASSSRPGTAK